MDIMDRRQLLLSLGLVSLGSYGMLASSAQQAYGEPVTLTPDALDTWREKAIRNQQGNVITSGIWTLRSKPDGLRSRNILPAQADYSRVTITCLSGFVSAGWVVNDREPGGTGGVITAIIGDGNSQFHLCSSAYITLAENSDIAQGYYIISK